MDIILSVFFVIGIGIAMWGAYRLGYISGRHHNRMATLDTVANLKYEIVNNMSVFEIQGLLLDRLKKTWDKVDGAYRKGIEK